MKKPLKLVRKKETIGSCLGRPKRERERGVSTIYF